MRVAARWSVPLYMAAILWVNAYICRDLFFAEYTGHMNSLQGLWISMARLAGEHWYRPAWWPYQDGGMPFEHTYMPLVPISTAAYAGLAHVSPSRAFNAITGIVYCLSPLTLFIMAWQMTRAPGYSFWAALAYSITSPGRASIPDPYFNPSFLWTSRRLYTTVVWDDVPHGAAVCLLPLAILFLWLSIEKRKPVYYAATVALIAGTVSASVFGATAIPMSVLCLLLGLKKVQLRSTLILIAIVGGLAYLIICPFLPPSVMATIRSNQQHFPEDQWSMGSVTALAAIGGGSLVVWLALRRWTQDGALRFFVLFGFLFTSIPMLDAYANRHFLPQSGRYLPEMELSLALVVVFLTRPLSEKLPAAVKVAVALVLLWGASQLIVRHRRYAKEITRGVDITRYIEYRVANWVDRHLPGQRVMVAGSVAQWFNAFSDTPQLSGASYSTTPNWNQQEAVNSVLTGKGPRETAVTMLWLKAFGIQAVEVSGPKSTEFWKPYADPRKFESLLPVLWREDDVTIYRVPQRSASLAHVIPEAALTPSPTELEKYVAALDDPSLPLAQMRWDGFRRATIRTTAHVGQVVSVQTDFHPGWHAVANGRAAAVRSDGIGFLAIQPGCNGLCEIELSYDGGWEYKICRSLSVLAILGCMTALAIWRRTSGFAR